MPRHHTTGGGLQRRHHGLPATSYGLHTERRVVPAGGVDDIQRTDLLHDQSAEGCGGETNDVVKGQGLASIGESNQADGPVRLELGSKAPPLSAAAQNPLRLLLQQGLAAKDNHISDAFPRHFADIVQQLVDREACELLVLVVETGCAIGPCGTRPLQAAQR